MTNREIRRVGERDGGRGKHFRRTGREKPRETKDDIKKVKLDLVAPACNLSYAGD